jgi:hypothetical protein
MTLRYAHFHSDYLKGATDVLCDPNLGHVGHKNFSAGSRLGHDMKKKAILQIAESSS